MIAMTYKPVGVDDAGRFPPRVENALMLTVDPRRRPRLGMLGDSISNQNGDFAPPTSPGSLWWNARGYLRWALASARHRFDVVTPSATDPAWGASGQTTADIIAGDLNACAAADLDVVIVFAGTNDIGQSATPETIMGRLQIIWNKLIESGKTVIAATILPRNNGEGANHAMTQRLRDTNRLIRAAAAATPGVFVVDWYAALTDPATGLAKVAYFPDGIHPNAQGAARMGALLADVLRFLAPRNDDLPLDNFDTRNVLRNGLLLGTTGAKSGSALTGDIATGCNAYQIGSPTSIVASKVARTGLRPGEWQQYVVTAADPKADGVQHQQQNTAVGVEWQVGEKVYATVEFETDAAAFDCRGMNLTIDFFGTSIGAADFRMASSERTTSTESFYRLADGMLRTPEIIIPSGTTRVQGNMYFWGSGTIRWGSMQVVKV